ncbi:2-keto-4-pentenoate hydratase [Streptomyces sp. CBMA29]|uniref:2-keto-4-pentenoate hydratase n=1 Tax=Streptomyces sp. CBMA29 TaxID=1896314 RepID=UPI001661E614|nr:fumarylacetoacetate hydrolase family protein [Streptomyces sp. CBMA29]
MVSSRSSTRPHGGSAPRRPAAAGEDAVAAAAARLIDAAARGVPCAPVRDLIGADDLPSAYAVQATVAAHRLRAGARVVGRKIGLTSPAVQQQLGVDQPDFGVLFDDMAFLGGDTVPIDRVTQPRVEAEIAFMLGDDLTEGPLDHAQVRGAIAWGSAALEVCGSRIADWDISFADTVADNASAGAYVIGPRRLSLDAFSPVEQRMSMSIGGDEVSAGTGAACLGDPVAAVVWLARTARELGDPLRAGQLVLSGALGPMRPVVEGDVVVARLSGLGAVQVRFGKGERA